MVTKKGWFRGRGLDRVVPRLGSIHFPDPAIWRVAILRNLAGAASADVEVEGEDRIFAYSYSVYGRRRIGSEDEVRSEC